MARISLEHVEKVYPNGYVAARDLSLEVADGELLVLVGPSGSGKSTILRLMAGLESVTGGSIRIGERDVTDLPPQQRDIAAAHSLAEGRADAEGDREACAAARHSR